MSAAMLALRAAETARISRIRKKPDFCFRGGRAKMLFQIFGLLHNAHDPFYVAAGNGRPHHFTTYRGS